MLSPNLDDSKFTRLKRQVMQLYRGTMTGVLLVLAVLPIYVVSPVLVAGPQQEQRIEPIPKTESASSSPADSPTSHKMPIHHPPGDLTGSYTLNTPARSGFWIAAGFTGFITLALIATFVLFRPGKMK